MCPMLGMLPSTTSERGKRFCDTGTSPPSAALHIESQGYVSPYPRDSVNRHQSLFASTLPQLLGRRFDPRVGSLLVISLLGLLLVSIYLHPSPGQQLEAGSYHVLSAVRETAGAGEAGLNSATGAASRRAGAAAPAQCASARYEKMTCPSWDPAVPDGGPDVDYRLRWMYQHQHPQNCSEENYLIRALTPRIGFGANMVLTMESSMYMAMYTNRIFLLDPDRPFRYADCQDKQWDCYFQPLSNCTIRDAEEITRQRGGRYDQVVHDPTHRVIRCEREEASVPRISGWIWYRRTWEHTWWNDLFMFPGDEEIVAGALMYTMRPTARVKERVEEVLHNVLSKHCDFDPERTISIPIRGSDKCLGNMHVDGGMDGESECFDGLGKYMEMAEDIRRLDPKVDTIILTSEDDRYLRDRHRYEEDGRWRFIVNQGDSVRGTGTLDVMEGQAQSLFDVFISFFSSLHLQMRGRYYILNCGSNFHMVLRTLVKYGGCGFVVNPVVYCLNEQYADYKLCSREGHEPCMQGKLEEIQVKSAAQGGRNITLDVSSMGRNYDVPWRRRA